MSNTHEYSCLKCAESTAKVNIKEIKNKEIIIEIECNNCLSKLVIEGRYFFIPFTKQSIDE